MLRVLLVKTSSLGDVVHNFPTVSDIREHFPDAAIDWVVEEAYVPLVKLHPGVRKVIPVALRRWRRKILVSETWRGIRAFRGLLQEEAYDAIIDTQGLLKSALISRSAHGRQHGFDATCVRERWAAPLYDVKHHVPLGQHAVVRNRQLVAASLDYHLEGTENYGLMHGDVRSRGVPYCLMLHGTSRSDKLWPVESWVELGRSLEALGIRCILPWGDESEHERSGQISLALQHAEVPQFMNLEQLVPLLSGAAFVVGVDTGLVHLAAALGVPVVAVFVASDPALTGIFGCPRSRNLGGAGGNVPVRDVMDALSAIRAL